jgi:predicted glycosyltransferase
VIVYYAIGGGLGHLVRARAVLHTLGVADAMLVTASPFAKDARVTGALSVIGVPPRLDGDRRGLARWLADLIASEQPERVIVDAFPAGVLGELAGLEVPVDHVARLLRWPRYARRLDGPLPCIDTTFVLEPLHPDHRAALESASDRLEPLTLIDPPAPQRDDAAGTALVVHAGPEHEVEALVALAGTTGHAVRIARPGGADLDVHPASALFASAAAIVTAAGFNAMRQAAPFRDRHVFVPFPRPLDDQFARATTSGSNPSFPHPFPVW